MDLLRLNSLQLLPKSWAQCIPYSCCTPPTARIRGCCPNIHAPSNGRETHRFSSWMLWKLWWQIRFDEVFWKQRSFQEKVVTKWPRATTKIKNFLIAAYSLPHSDQESILLFGWSQISSFTFQYIHLNLFRAIEQLMFSILIYIGDCRLLCIFGASETLHFDLLRHFIHIKSLNYIKSSAFKFPSREAGLWPSPEVYIRYVSIVIFSLLQCETFWFFCKYSAVLVNFTFMQNDETMIIVLHNGSSQTQLRTQKDT